MAMRALLLFGLLPALLSTSLPAKATRLIIIGTNDVHGHLESLPVLSSHIAGFRKTEKHILFVDAGDMFQGTLESNINEGEAVVAAYNLMGMDAVAVGNHEYDFGPVGDDIKNRDSDRLGALRARAAQARFPFLAANMIDETTGLSLRGPGFASSVVITKGNIRIGVIGVSTIDTKKTTLQSNLVGRRVGSLVDAIMEQATYVRRNGAQVVVLVAHAGAKCELGGTCKEGEILDVVAALPKGTVHAVVAGHTHSPIAHVVADVAVIESYANGRAFGRIDLDVTEGNVRIEKVHAPTDIAALTEKPDAKIAALLQPYIDAARGKKDTVLGTAAATAKLLKGYDKESVLGDAFADWMRDAFTATTGKTADIALMNGGGIRSDIDEGPITYGDLFLVMPFDNRLASTQMTAKEIARVLQKNLDPKKKGGIFSTSGLGVVVRCPSADVVLTRDGAILPDDTMLSVVTTDFVAQGGDDGLMIDDARITVDDSGTMRDHVASVLSSRGSIAPSAFGQRIIERGGHCSRATVPVTLDFAPVESR
jgi:2',3'-cyclic-nucleotide 2'-phosphodiesterase (5'-nucleotidase family)